MVRSGTQGLPSSPAPILVSPHPCCAAPRFSDWRCGHILGHGRIPCTELYVMAHLGARSREPRVLVLYNDTSLRPQKTQPQALGGSFGVFWLGYSFYNTSYLGQRICRRTSQKFTRSEDAKRGRNSREEPPKAEELITIYNVCEEFGGCCERL